MEDNAKAGNMKDQRKKKDGAFGDIFRGFFVNLRLLSIYFNIIPLMIIKSP
jgi:hypothetical protein